MNEVKIRIAANNSQVYVTIKFNSFILVLQIRTSKSLTIVAVYFGKKSH